TDPGGECGEHPALPAPVTAIAPIALEDPRTIFPQAMRKLCVEGLGRSIDMRVGAPTEILGSIENLLHAHLHDDVGVSADPNAPSGDVAQHRVERRPGLTPGARDDPD